MRKGCKCIQSIFVTCFQILKSWRVSIGQIHSVSCNVASPEALKCHLIPKKSLLEPRDYSAEPLTSFRGSALSLALRGPNQPTARSYPAKLSIWEKKHDQAEFQTQKMCRKEQSHGYSYYTTKSFHCF